MPSHQLFKSVSEFRLVKGVSARFFKVLSSRITALPEKTAININTASKHVLMTLGNGLDEKQFEKLEKIIGKKKDIKNIAHIRTQLMQLKIPYDQVTAESQYYLSKAITSSGDMSLIKYSLLKRSKDKKGNIVVTVESESLNAL
jgi:general secretion pathway protein K